MPRRHRLDSSSSTRPGTARARLTRALVTLIERAPKPSKVTVAELCRLANISRNSLYRYHAPILAELRKHQRPEFSARARALRSAERHRIENSLLRNRVVKLAALVDHYFAAYRETAVLLARRERELAELRREDRSRPTMLRSSAHIGSRQVRSPEGKGSERIRTSG
jgi:hypothetical protein